jgi:hypothetical protein
MEMRRLTILAVISAMAVCSAVAVWSAGSEDPISQGDFAVLLASHLRQPVPPGGWAPASATAFLADIQITPVSGTWSVATTLNDGNLVHILRVMGQPLYSPEPDAPVTYAKAYAVLARFDDFFLRYLLNKTAKNSTTTHIDTGLGAVAAGAPAPASPSTP